MEIKLSPSILSADFANLARDIKIATDAGAEYVHVDVMGRGTLLSTAELAAVLADGHLSGAVLDVCDTEPLPPASPLWGMENVLLTPHVSGRGFGHDRGTERLIWEIVMDNLARYLEGKKLRHIVDINRGY